MTNSALTSTENSPSLKILAVEDDALILMNMVDMLEDLGHTILEARSGAVALDTLDKNSVDLIIADQAMPGMTGTELAGVVHTTLPSLPVVIATGYAALPNGTNINLLRLEKPYTQEDLRQIISRAMANV